MFLLLLLLLPCSCISIASIGETLNRELRLFVCLFVCVCVCVCVCRVFVAWGELSFTACTFIICTQFISFATKKLFVLPPKFPTRQAVHKRVDC